MEADNLASHRRGAGIDVDGSQWEEPPKSTQLTCGSWTCTSPVWRNSQMGDAAASTWAPEASLGKFVTIMDAEMLWTAIGGRGAVRPDPLKISMSVKGPSGVPSISKSPSSIEDRKVKVDLRPAGLRHLGWENRAVKGLTYSGQQRAWTYLRDRRVSGFLLRIRDHPKRGSPYNALGSAGTGKVGGGKKRCYGSRVLREGVESGGTGRF
ncbi:hypothetical protein BGX38DRAFT_1277029 [Terfezia claveryi]|nr:hypothetical protein BGX38DRAFT_1277029 [Terfezia claveryi]